jgi:hypothetical protein
MLVDELIFEVRPQTLVYGLTKKGVSIKNMGGIIVFKKQEQAELEKKCGRNMSKKEKLKRTGNLKKDIST